MRQETRRDRSVVPLSRAAALVASLLVAAGSAAATSRPRFTLGRAPDGPGGGFATLASAALANQTPNPLGDGLASQSFPDAPDFSGAMHDDFEVPAGDTWDIESFHVDGAYDVGVVVPDSYALEIFPDDSGAPACGSPIYSVILTPGAAGLADALGVFDYCPGGVLTTLTPGRYWIAVSVTMDFATRGQWFWATHATPHVVGLAGVFDNPGGGFGFPPCAPPPGEDHDLAFEIGGVAVPADLKACRAGNVNTGVGAAADVLTVDGSSGDPECREVGVTAGVPVTIAIVAPPAGGSGHYALWISDGEPSAETLTMILYEPQSGVIHDLGLGCVCLPANNTVVPGACPCPVSFPQGRTSRRLGAQTATNVCLNRRPGFPRYPTSFQQTFPAGTFTLGGLILDAGSQNTKPISLMNWVIVRSN